MTVPIDSRSARAEERFREQGKAQRTDLRQEMGQIRREHETSVASLLRQPQGLHDYLRELRSAVEAEPPSRLHQSGVEVEGDSGGSHLGTPRWTVAFRRWISGSPFATYEADGEVFWESPHRSAVARMETSKSGVTRASAAYVFLLPLHRFSVREAWAAQVGRLADPIAIEAAEAWAAEALRRWWTFYVQPPRGRELD